MMELLESAKVTGFSDSWEENCLRYWDVVLDGKFAHYCYDWDALPIDETCKEFEYCNCEWEDE